MPLLLCLRLTLALALIGPAAAVAGPAERPMVVAQGGAGVSEGPVREPRDSAPREAPPPAAAPRETAPRIEIPRVVVPGVNSPRLDAPRDVPRAEPRDPPPSGGTTRHGALAAGWSSRMWYAAAWNRATGPQAETAAMEGCENRAPRRSSSRCRILYTFTTCAALAWTRTGAGFGAAVRETREAAAEAALFQCQTHNRRRSCQSAGAWCAND